MSDLGGQGRADAEDLAPTEAANNGSASRRGSAASVAADPKQPSADNDADLLAEQRRESTASFAAPSSGGNDSMGSLPRDGEIGGASSTAGALRKESSASLAAVAVVEGEAEGYMDVVAWVKEHLVLPEFAPVKHWRQQHDKVSQSCMYTLRCL